MRWRPAWKPPALSRAERLLAVGCAAVIILLVVDRAILAPWQRHTARVRREVYALEQMLAGERRLLAMKDQVTVEAERFRDFLRPAMEKELQMAALFKEVERLAKLSGVTLNGVKPLADRQDDLSQTYTLAVNCDSSLAQLVRFIYLIETSPSLFQIEEVSLDVKEDQSGLEGLLRLSAVAMRGAIKAVQPPDLPEAPT